VRLPGLKAFFCTLDAVLKRPLFHGDSGGFFACVINLLTLQLQIESESKSPLKPKAGLNGAPIMINSPDISS
jgi:hypothetical protein